MHLGPRDNILNCITVVAIVQIKRLTLCCWTSRVCECVLVYLLGYSLQVWLVHGETVGVFLYHCACLSAVNFQAEGRYTSTLIAHVWSWIMG